MWKLFDSDAGLIRTIDHNWEVIAVIASNKVHQQPNVEVWAKEYNELNQPVKRLYWDEVEDWIKVDNNG